MIWLSWYIVASSKKAVRIFTRYAFFAAVLTLQVHRGDHGGNRFQAWALSGSATAMDGPGCFTAWALHRYFYWWPGCFAPVRKLRFMTMSEELSYYTGGSHLIKNLVGIMIFIASIGWLGAHILGGDVLLWATELI
ncbi:hypothetical protein MJ584_04040 [Klebsiella pneumoniae]|nr:hypothetical protein MJ584_04040 [Klebsiella pneumoniae]